LVEKGVRERLPRKAAALNERFELGSSIQINAMLPRRAAGFEIAASTGIALAKKRLQCIVRACNWFASSRRRRSSGNLCGQGA